VSALLVLSREVDFADATAFAEAAPRMIEALVADGLALRLHDEAYRLLPGGQIAVDLLRETAQLRRDVKALRGEIERLRPWPPEGCLA
jgi:hypothetical protein